MALGELNRLAANDEQRQLCAWRAGQLSLRRGEAKTAAAALAPLLQRGSVSQRLSVAKDWAQATAQQGLSVKAATELAKLGRRHGRTSEGRDAWYRAAQIAQEEGHFALAIDLYTSLLRHQPRFAQAEEARWRAAWCAYRLGDARKAAPLLAEAERTGSARVLKDRARYWRGRLAM